MSQSGTFLTCETQQGLMDIYVSAPKNIERAPVLIVLQEAFGVNHHIREVCDRFAQEGFYVAAPELYHREGRRIEVPYDERKDFMPLIQKMTNSNIIQDVRNTINFLDDLPGVDTQNISTVGFCVGGFASTLCATKLNVKKIVSFYGSGMVRPREGFELSPLLPNMNAIKSKCLFFFGGQDASIPETDIEEIKNKLKASKVSFEIKIFENANHGFFCNERKAYDEEAASISWEKTLAFLKD